MEKRYKINIKQAWLKAFFDINVICCFICALLIDKEWIPFENLLIKIIVCTISIPMIAAVLCTPLFLIYKTQQLVFSKTGLYQEYRFFGHTWKRWQLAWTSGMTAIKLVDGVFVTDSKSRLIKIVDDIEKIQVQQQIDIKLWQNMTMNEMIANFQQFGIVTIEMSSIELQKKIPDEISNIIGKRTQYIVGASVCCIVLFLIITMFDKWSTIYYGVFHYYWGVVSILVAILVARWIYLDTTKKKNLVSIAMVSVSFTASFAMLLLSVILLVSPVISSKQQMTFEYLETNQYGEEIWQAVDDSKLEIYCRKSTSEVKQPQTTTVIKTFSILRVNRIGLCPNSNFLSDGTLPHK